MRQKIIKPLNNRASGSWLFRKLSDAFRGKEISGMKWVNPLQPGVAFLYPLKKPENL